MAWALHRTEKEKPAAGKTDYWRDFWRSGWDSNPRNLAVQLISSQSRYDHFDTAPYLSQHQHLGKRGELMGRTSKNIKLRIPEKPHKIKGFRSGSYRVATTISSGSSIPKIKQTYTATHDYYDAEMQVFNDINAERAKAGLSALIWDEALYAGTKVRVNEFYDWACGKHNAGPHNRPNGDEPYTAMWEYDNGTLKPFRSYGENCIGMSDYSKFASEWMDSDSHRPQILSGKYTRTAIAIIYCSDGLYYATQFFVG